MLVPDQKLAYCSWYFPKTVDKFCFNLTKMTSYMEYLMHRIFNNNNNNNNNKNRSGRGLQLVLSEDYR